MNKKQLISFANSMSNDDIVSLINMLSERFTVFNVINGKTMQLGSEYWDSAGTNGPYVQLNATPEEDAEVPEDYGTAIDAAEYSMRPDR